MPLLKGHLRVSWSLHLLCQSMRVFHLLHCEDGIENAVYVRDPQQTLTLQTAVSDFPDLWETNLYCIYITVPNVWYSSRNKLRPVCRDGRAEEAWGVDLTPGLTAKGWTVRETNLSRTLWQEKEKRDFQTKGQHFWRDNKLGEITQHSNPRRWGPGGTWTVGPSYILPWRQRRKEAYGQMGPYLHHRKISAYDGMKVEVERQYYQKSHWLNKEKTPDGIKDVEQLGLASQMRVDQREVARNKGHL